MNSTRSRMLRRQVLRFAQAIKDRIEYFWSGVWWTRWRLCRQEAMLGRVLDVEGEDSLLARAETEQVRRLQKGVWFWRPSDARVISALEAAERAGVPRRDLKILALNRDVLISSDKVCVRRPLLPLLLGYAGLILMLSQWVLLTALISLSPAGLLAKIAGIVVLSLIDWLIWHGFGLYTTSAHAAARRAGPAVESAGRVGDAGRAPVVPIRPV